MSYILEALKKAQAERQLGSTPGIHDTSVATTAAHAGPAPARLWLALGGALLLAGAGFAAMRLLEKPQWAPVPEATVQAAVATAPLPVEPPVRPAAPQASAPAIVAQAPEVASPAPVAAPQPEAPAPEPAPAPAPPRVQAQAEESLPTLASLDPGLAASIPRVALAGYIYSPVPSERLVLVDKDLRREGDEVAPGLILEKLLPSGAVMNYRGTRFRVPY